MANNNFIHFVENMCKNTWKTQRKNSLKSRVKFYVFLESCVKNPLFTSFYIFIHQLLNSLFLSVTKLIYPLFHNPYYNNYLIFK